MKPQIYKIKAIGLGSLSVMAKPVSGEWLEDEFRFYRDSGITLIVSLLEEFEAYELGLQGERDLAARHYMGFLHFPILDRGLPESLYHFKNVISDLYRQIQGGEHAAVHCRAGIGRSGLVAAALLLRAGFEPVEAFAAISEKRRVIVPDTQEQREWLVTNWKDLI